MKKIIGFIVLAGLIPLAWMGGCANSGTGPWSGSVTFLTPQAPQAMVDLGSAANDGILAYSAITNSGHTTLCGSLGISPLSSVSGGIVLDCGGVRDIDDTVAGIAKGDLNTAYTDAAGRSGGELLPGGSDIGGDRLQPGLYTCNGNLSVSSKDLTLDAKGNSNAVFIFQVAGNLNATSGRKVLLVGRAQASHVFWQVAGFCSLGTTVSFVGTIMAYTSVTLNTGATLNGRALAENGNVTLLANTITVP